MLPDPIKKFVDAFSGLPGIGPRQATRLAFHVKNLGNATVGELAKAVYGLTDVKTCEQCFFTYENTKTYESTKNGLCYICANPQRRKDLIAIVEKETDLISLEKSKKFNGRYLVLGDLKKDGVLDAMQKLRLQSLKNWIKKNNTNNTNSYTNDANTIANKAEEIILAINPTTYGDINADLIANELKDSAKCISRLGRGIPTGGEIEFADEETLGGAIDNRK